MLMSCQWRISETPAPPGADSLMQGKGICSSPNRWRVFAVSAWVPRGPPGSAMCVMTPRVTLLPSGFTRSCCAILGAMGNTA